MAVPITMIPAGLTGVPVQMPVEAYAATGAINLVAGGLAILTKAGVGVMTLAAPAADGAVLVITSKTAQAHTVTVTGAAGGAGQDVGTFGGAINDSTTLVSYNSEWYVISTRNVTWA